MASVIQSRLLKKEGGIYASNWLERLRKIKIIKTRVTELKLEKNDSNVPEKKQEPVIDRRSSMCDFTEYTA